MSREIADLAIRYIQTDVSDLRERNDVMWELYRETGDRGWNSRLSEQMFDDAEILARAVNSSESVSDVAGKISQAVVNYNALRIGIKDPGLFRQLKIDREDALDSIARYEDTIDRARGGGRRTEYRDVRRTERPSRGSERNVSRSDDRYGVNSRQSDMGRYESRRTVQSPPPAPEPRTRETQPAPVVETAKENIVKYDQHRLATQWFIPMTTDDASRRTSTVEDFKTAYLDPVVAEMVKRSTGGSRTNKKTAIYQVIPSPIELESHPSMDMYSIVQALGEDYDSKVTYFLNLHRPSPITLHFSEKPEFPTPKEITHASNIALMESLIDGLDETLARSFIERVTQRVQVLMARVFGTDYEIDSYWLDGNQLAGVILAAGHLTYAKLWDALAEVIYHQCLTFNITKSQSEKPDEDGLPWRLEFHTQINAVLIPLHSGNAPLSMEDPTQLNRVDPRDCPELHRFLCAAFDRHREEDPSYINLVYFNNGDCLEAAKMGDDWFVTKYK